MKKKKVGKTVFSALVLLVAGYSQTAGAGNPNPGVMPINSHAFGKSYGVWGQEFDQWLFQFSLAEFPLFQGSEEVDCGKDQKGKVWFLYGALSDGVERSCTIPNGKALFISVNSVLSWDPDFGVGEDEVRDDAKRDLDGTDTTAGVQTLEVVIDGVPLNDPFSYRASSPEGGFVLTIAEGTILNELGFEAGDRDPAIVDGYWLLLPPLSTGEHTIEWASTGESQAGAYSYSIRWDLTVGKKRRKTN